MKRSFKTLMSMIALVSVLSLGSCGTKQPAPSTPEGDQPSGGETVEKTFTVKWMVDGEVVEIDNDVKKGTMPKYDGQTPTKAADAINTYTFNKWSPELAPVTADITYTALFNKTVNKYTVKWQVEGEIVETDTGVNAGTMPEYNGKTPTKAETKTHTYKFDKWEPTPSQVTKDITYTAKFTETIKTFKVKWVVEGTVVETDEKVNAGTTPVYNGSKPTKAATAQYTYTFKGWDKEVKAIYEDTTYTAVFDKTVNRYTITFNTLGGSEIASITDDYGTIVNEPTKPVKENYKFVGWALKQDGQDAVTFPYTITGDVTMYAIWNARVGIMDYVDALLKNVKFNPIAYIPETLLPDYAPNLMDNENQMDLDYSAFVNKSQLHYQGYGEQWNMIQDNLNQSHQFFKYLSIIENTATTSVEVFNNFFDKNPEDTAKHTLKVGEYDVTIQFDKEILNYALSFTVKEQTAEIWLTLNVKTGARSGRIQIGDANAIRYVYDENSYTFGLRALGIRRSYFQLNRNPDTGVVEGFINEHTGYDGKLDVISAAKFIIDENHTIAVGNKVEAMPGTKPVVVEAYNNKTGRLLGFEVQESIKKIVYNTMFFDLNNFTGINSFRFEPNPDKVSRRQNLPYVNGATTVLETPNCQGDLLKSLSRACDLELRDRFFNYKKIDTEGKVTYETKKCPLPMFFIQEEQLDTYLKAFNKENKAIGLNVQAFLNQADIDLISSNYNSETLIPNFNTEKEKIGVEEIKTFIGTSFITTIVE